MSSAKMLLNILKSAESLKIMMIALKNVKPRKFYSLQAFYTFILANKKLYGLLIRNCPQISTITTLWANSADDKLIISFFYFFQKMGFDISCNTISLGDNLHEMSKLIFWEKHEKKKI